MDLHLHTPASVDYQEPQVSPLDILRAAEARGLDILAFTDHNSVRGYANLWREIEDLELLEYLDRLQPAEAARLAEYRRFLGSMLLLPGFEFTATFGFHILAIFPEATSVRLMEHLLLLLGVPEERFGSGEVGATSDVLKAYEILSDHGALVIGAHVNSTHGIAMQGMRFGGQTKIAYTQDEHLHALEVTDLALGMHRRSTARFFNGTKPEYPRRMHCIQGSDAHRLERDPLRETNLGIGDRATEVLLPAVSFANLRALFLGQDFDRTRPYVAYTDPAAAIKAARADGNTAEQAFHESLTTKRTGMTHVLRDLVAFANTGGGTVYAGVSPFEKRPIAGVGDAAAAVAALQAEIAAQVSPAPIVEIETIPADGKNVLVLRVPVGAEQPYALAGGAILVRREGESAPAERDEIVAMVRGSGMAPAPVAPPLVAPAPIAPSPSSNGTAPDAAEPPITPDAVATPARSRRAGRRRASAPTAPGVDRTVEVSEDAPDDPVAPGSGVEVVASYDQDGVTYYTLHDLRHHKLVHNVTAETPRRLWRYAIREHDANAVAAGKIRWTGDLGYWKSHKPRGGDQRYNLVARDAEDGRLRVFYGVGEEGLDGAWRPLVDAQAPGRDPAPERAPATA